MEVSSVNSSPQPMPASEPSYANRDYSSEQQPEAAPQPAPQANVDILA